MSWIRHHPRGTALLLPTACWDSASDTARKAKGSLCLEIWLQESGATPSLPQISEPMGSFAGETTWHNGPELQ